MQNSLTAPGLPEIELAPSSTRTVRFGSRRWQRMGGWLTVALVVAGGIAWWLLRPGSAAADTTYRTARLQRGNIVQTVSATGPLSAVSTVEVGSQVSGNIARLYVDFNDTVRAGQLIAEIDPATYQSRVAQADGDLLSARITLELRQLAVQRSATLLEARLVAQVDHDQAVADLHQAEAVVQIKQAALKSAQLDLDRTKIRSPVDGVVINRNIDAGQTVQASFSAPTLFTVAQDLRQMEITANVSEADIGGVLPDRPVSFTVDAFPAETFVGKVRQVRNNTTITNNVVTYPTIITVDNPDLKLRPGMTANVTITVAERTAVLRVPNAALRFHPPETAVLVAPAQPYDHTLYLLHGEVDAAGRATGGLEPVKVQVGLSDSSHTEILSGVAEGTLVATGLSLNGAKGAASAATPTNPFMPKMPATRGTKR